MLIPILSRLGDFAGGFRQEFVNELLLRINPTREVPHVVFQIKAATLECEIRMYMNISEESGVTDIRIHGIRIVEDLIFDPVVEQFKVLRCEIHRL